VMERLLLKFRNFPRQLVQRRLVVLSRLCLILTLIPQPN
jgi:hypothetical protein